MVIIFGSPFISFAELRLDAPPFVPSILLLAAVVLGVWVWRRRLLVQIARQTSALRENEERLRHVLDGSEDGFWDWDMASGRVARSERWAAMLGYTMAEIGPRIEAGTILVHPDDLASYHEVQERLNRGEIDRYEIEYRMKAKSGQWRWILDRGKVVARDAQGRPMRLAGTHTDVTERKRTEAALLESQRLLKRSAQLLEQTQSAAHTGGWESDLRSGRIYWTRETHRIHETDAASFMPTRENVFSFFTSDSRQILAQAVEAAVRDGTPYALDLELITAKQRRIHVHVRGVPEREGPDVVKLYGSVRDITAEKTAELERERLRLKMLETQKLESLGVLAGGIAHDFNNLLTVILANATFVRGERGPNDDRLHDIEAAARRAADLCRQMLAYAGKGTFVVEPVDLGTLVRDTTQLLKVSISKKARLQFSLAPDLPMVDADPSQLRQVVMNLVINASEALADASGDIRLTTCVARPQPPAAGLIYSFDLPPRDCVCLEVVDTGQGMSAGTLARIFDPFFTTKFAGRGLGLAAVLGIVRAHHGGLTVESVPGRGSTFRLYLPVSAKTTPGTTAPASPPAAAQGGNGTILIAEDEAVLLTTMDALLRHHGYRTVLANDGSEALEKYRAKGPFALVILDLTMPGLDGAEVLRAIRAAPPSPPVLVMSGFSEQDVFSRLQGLGQVPILRKPFSKDALLSRIAELTGPRGTA